MNAIWQVLLALLAAVGLLALGWLTSVSYTHLTLPTT